MYCIQATIVQHTPQGDFERSLPTFYLDPTVQGITNARHARQIAADIVDPFHLPKKMQTVHIHAEKV